MWVFLYEESRDIEASYDFRTLSLQDLTNEGWLYWDYIALTSSWAVASQDWSWYLQCPVDISDAKKITVKVVYYWYYGSWNWWASFGLRSTYNSNDYTYCGINFEYNTNYNYNRLYVLGSEKTNTPYAPWTGEWTYTMTIDFETWEMSYVWEWMFTLTYTLSSAEIAWTKALPYIQMDVWNYWWSQHKLYSMEYKIEF